MIYFFIGTKAQMIKMAPLLKEARDRGVPYRYIDSGQHHEGCVKMLRMFDLPEPHVWLNRGSDLSTIPRLAGWFIKLLFKLVFNPGWIRRELFPEPGVCLVHGDTVTTMLGVLFARRVGVQVAHVESGLRSGSFLEPFPEELIRVVSMHLCNILFTPDDVSELNLRRMKVRGQIVPTRANTILDTIRMLEGRPVTVEIPKEPFVVVSCHRFELIYNRKRMLWMLEALELLARQYLVVVSVHEPTENRLRHYGLWDRLASMKNVKLIPPQDYANFIALERASVMVVADGGSVQEETYYLGKPCLILRERTERENGLGETAELAKFDLERVKAFVGRLGREQAPSSRFDELRPSRQIIDFVSKG